MPITIPWEEECPNCREIISSDNSSSIVWNEIKVEFVCPECGCEFTATYEWGDATDITVTKEGKNEG